MEGFVALALLGAGDFLRADFQAWVKAAVGGESLRVREPGGIHYVCELGDGSAFTDAGSRHQDRDQLLSFDDFTVTNRPVHGINLVTDDPVIFGNLLGTVIELLVFFL